MAIRFIVAPIVAASLTFSSTAAIAQSSGSSALPSACGAAVAAGAAAVAQPRPGCVLPAIDAGVPVATEAAAVNAAPFGGWILPVLGLAGLAALILALKGGNGNGSGSLSRG